MPANWGKCRGLIKSLTGEISGVISTQVMQEFYVAATLWTEDLNHGQVIRGVRIENPLK
jgi:hypothetical protein